MRIFHPSVSHLKWFCFALWLGLSIASFTSCSADVLASPSGSNVEAAEEASLKDSALGKPLDLSSLQLKAAHTSNHTTEPTLGKHGTAFIFVRSDCPISNRYAPEYGRLIDEFEAEGITFHFVYLDPDESFEQIKLHRKEYQIGGEAWIDARHELVQRTGATVTPEAIVLAADRTLVYRGRMDDRYVGFGKSRQVASRKDVHEILSLLVDGKEVTPRSTKAVGCFIRDLTP